MPKDVEQSQIILSPRRKAAGELGQGPAPGGPRPGRRRSGLFVSLALAALAAIVVLAGLLIHFGSTSLLGPGEQATVPAGLLGSFVKSPYNPSQVNALMHLVDSMTYRELANLYVAHMSLDEKLGQLIMTESEQNNYSDDLDYMITQLHVGGMIMYESHLQTSSQARATISQAQQRAKIPLLTSVDEEGGSYVNRLVHIYGARPGPWEISQSGSLATDRQQGEKMAHDLLSLGLNTDLAPDVDVMIIPGADTYDRTFGTTADSVIKYTGPYIEAMQSNGLIACMKHYPGGMGNTPYDAHDILPTDNRSRDQIYATELAPYKTFINSPNPLMRPAMIMSTDVLMPAIDPTWPAELSHKFMTDILRKEFGYDGVVLTDALYMQGISQIWTMPQAAVLALNAGDDMLLGPTGTDQMLDMLNGLKAALHNGTLSKARVDEAATRIITLKMQYHLMPAVAPHV